MSDSDLNETHDPKRRSWVESANAPDSDFPIQNLPFGVFRRDGGDAGGGVAIGDQILDLGRCLDEGLFDGEVSAAARVAASAPLNRLMAQNRPQLSALRRRLSEILRSGGREEASIKSRANAILAPMADAEMETPAAIGDYTDFSCSTYHMMRMGGGVVRPVFLQLPVGYHGRSSTIYVSGTEARRPWGQFADDGGDVVYGPEPKFDFELELAAFVGCRSALGRTLSIAQAEDHIFGYCLLNDWSARGIQIFESALGPFLGKSFLTTISPWVVTHEAMAPFRTAAFARPVADPPAPNHLDDTADRRQGGLDIELTAYLSTQAMRAERRQPHRIVASNSRDLYWTFAQMLTHHASNGCELRPGDLFASGTVSGPNDDAKACLMEANERGSKPLKLPGGEQRLWLEDGDELTIRGKAKREGYISIGFGACAGLVAPAEPREA